MHILIQIKLLSHGIATNLFVLILYFENPVINTELCLPVNSKLRLSHSVVVLLCLWPIEVWGYQGFEAQYVPKVCPPHHHRITIEVEFGA